MLDVVVDWMVIHLGWVAFIMLMGGASVLYLRAEKIVRGLVGH